MKVNKSLLLLSLLGISQLAMAAELPPQVVGPFDFKTVPITDAIKTIFSNTGIEVVPNHMPTTAVSAMQVQGSLPDVMRALSQQANLDYTYQNGRLYVYGNQADPVPAPAPKPAVQRAPVKAPVVAAVAEEMPQEEVVEAPPAPAPIPKKRVAAAAPKPAAEVPAVKTVVADAKPAAAPLVDKGPLVTSVAPVKAVDTPSSYTVKLTAGSGVKAILATSAKANGYILNWEGEDLYVRYDASFTGLTFEDMLNQIFSSIKVNGYISNNNNNGRVIYVVSK